MGKASRDKGARAEREVVNILRAYGFDTARRTGEYQQYDILCNLDGHDRILEVKVRKSGCGSALLYSALGEGIFGVVHKSDREPWLITFNLKDWLDRIAPVPGEESE
jgi:hypothetical protein